MTCDKVKKIHLELKELIKNSKTTSEEYKNFYKKHGIPYNNNVEVTIENNCGYSIGQSSENIIEIPEECVDKTKAMCLKIGPDGKGSFKYDNCLRRYGPKISDIYQSNTGNTNSSCIINNILADPKLAADKNMALVVAMIMADREVDCNPNNENSFYDTFNNEEKIQAINTCINLGTLEQKNYLSGCQVSNVLQNNISNSIDKCKINLTISDPNPKEITQPPRINFQPRKPQTKNPEPDEDEDEDEIEPIVKSPSQQKQPAKKISTKKNDTTPPPTTTNSPSNGLNLVLIVGVGFAILIIIILIILKIKNII
jgi:hypothetical protein